MEMALQQQGTKVWQYCTSMAQDAELGDSFDEMPEAGAATAITDKFADVVASEQTSIRRWLTTSPWQAPPKLYSDLDAAYKLSMPSSDILTSMRWSLERKKDDVAIAAMYGDTKRGIDQPGDLTAESFDATNQTVAVTVGNGGSGNVGLNPDKITEACRILMANYVSESEEKHCAISAKQWADWLKNSTAMDKTRVQSNVNGETGEFRYLGVQFHVTERLPVDGSSYRRCFMWVSRGLKVGEPIPIRTSLERQTQKVANPWLAQAWMKVGAARTNTKYVVEIKCAES